MAIIDEQKAFGDVFYSGDVENVRRILAIMGIGTAQLDSVRPEDLAIYQREIDRIINSRVSAFYAVPLAKNADGFFPDPVPYIAVRLVAADLVHNEFTEIDANESEAALSYKNNALLELDRLTAGILAPSQRIRGQRPRSRNHFVRPAIAPLTEPPAPRDR